MLIIIVKKMKNIEILFWFLLAQHDITDSVGATHNVARPLIILRAGVSSSLGGRRYSQFRIVRINPKKVKNLTFLNKFKNII